MKILIAISSKKYSTQTLEVGMRVAKAFSAKTTIVDVGGKINQFSLKEVGVAQERMESWDIDRPGIDVLEWAFDFLSKNKFIEKNEIEAGFPKNTLIERGGRRSEVFLKGTICDDVSLILRNGEIIEELINEVQKEVYDVTIIGKINHEKDEKDEKLNNGLQKCNKCNEDLKLINFSQDNNYATGLKPTCRICLSKNGEKSNMVGKPSRTIHTIIDEKEGKVCIGCKKWKNFVQIP